uniref:Integrase catalytic domain-containing protein n=1 Tax=Amphimedon queenslandica TaxID=400682 RepID=A0A1X7VLE3_AMPQE
MGLPSVIITDQRREFHNQFNSELMSLFDIKHRMTSPYHPQANGLDERYNQALINSLAKYVQQNHDQWDEKLSEVVYAYNTAIQEPTKYSPFEVMLGRKAKLPIDFNH